MGIILALVLGINLSSAIDDNVLYFLFWLMYVITIGTLVNIGMSGYYYSVMKNKTGPKGPRGERGSPGELGKTATCDPECRGAICQSGVLDHIISAVADEERKAGVPQNERLTLADFKNVFVKERIKTMCQSPEFKQLAPYKGEQNLINYVKVIWADIARRLYRSGGSAYFRTIGAENSWDWVDENPWNEFKKYDIYYWGLGPEYRPIIEEKCDSKIAENDIKQHPNPKNMLGKSGDKVYKPPSKRDAKYSILGYVNTPSEITVGTGGAGGGGIANWVKAVNKNTRTNVKLYNATGFKPTPEVVQKYPAGGPKKSELSRKPMSYMVANSNNAEMCISMNKGNTSYTICDPWDKSQIFQMEFTGDQNSKMREFRLKHIASSNYLGNKGYSFNSTGKNINTADIYKFK